MLPTTILVLIALAAAPAYASKAADTKVAAAWYAGFHAEEGFPLSKVSWNKYNTLIYSFAETTPSVHSVTLNGSDGGLLPQFVEEAHKNGVKAHISIGGWTGGRWYSTNVGSAANRTAFVNTVTDFVTKYDLDGVNFDWEYPNNQGIGCNTINSNDTANFLAYLQELRKTPVGANITLSAATAVAPFMDASGSPSSDVSGFAKVLDYVAIMNYDIWGSWSSAVGPNSPLDDSCALAADQQGSAMSAVKAWTKAGIPANKIVLGVASYGHSFSVNATSAFGSSSTKATKALVAYPAFNASNQPLGDKWDDTGSVDVCGVYEGPGGDWDLWGLVDGGFLDQQGNPAKGIYYRYDNCSQTPYVYNTTSEVMVSFDNAQSIKAKGAYVKQAGLLGWAFWEAGGDYNDILLDAIHSTSGF